VLAAFKEIFKSHSEYLKAFTEFQPDLAEQDQKYNE